MNDNKNIYLIPILVLILAVLGYIIYTNIDMLGHPFNLLILAGTFLALLIPVSLYLLWKKRKEKRQEEEIEAGSEF